MRTGPTSLRWGFDEHHDQRGSYRPGEPLGSSSGCAGDVQPWAKVPGLSGAKGSSERTLSTAGLLPREGLSIPGQVSNEVTNEGDG